MSDDLGAKGPQIVDVHEAFARGRVAQSDAAERDVEIWREKIQRSRLVRALLRARTEDANDRQK